MVVGTAIAMSVGERVAASIATTVVKAAYSKVKTAVLGDEQARALEAVLNTAIEESHRNFSAKLSPEQLSALEDVIKRFTSDDEVLAFLVRASISDPNLEKEAASLSELFHQKGYDQSTLQLPLKELATQLLRHLYQGLVSHAAATNSPLYPLISVQQLSSIQENVRGLKTLIENTKSAGSNQALIALEQRAEALSNRLSEQVTKSIDHAIDLYRQGKKNKAFEEILKIRNDTEWEYLTKEAKSKSLKILATWHYNKFTDLKEVSALVDLAKTIHPEDDFTVIDSLILLRNGQKEDALQLLDKNKTVNALNLKLIIFLAHGQFSDVLEKIKDVDASLLDAESYSIKALAQAYLSDFKGAWASIDQAAKKGQYPRIVEIAKYKIHYLAALSKPTFPEEHMQYPNPVLPFFFREDSEAIEHTKAARKGSQLILTYTEIDDPSRDEIETWHLAALALNTKSPKDAKKQCLKLLSQDHCNYHIFLWARHLDLQIKSKHLQRAIAFLEPGHLLYVERVANLTLALLHQDLVKEARELLDSAKKFCTENDYKDIWYGLHIHLLLKEQQETTEAEKELSLVKDDNRRAELIRLIKFKNEAFTPESDSTALVVSKEQDLTELAISCHNRAENGQIKFASAEIDRLINDIGTSWAINLAAHALWNTPRLADKERCHKLLEEYTHVFASGALSEELEHIKIGCLLKLGQFPLAIQIADKLKGGNNSTNNLLRYVEALVYQGEVSALERPVRELLKRTDVLPQNLLRIANSMTAKFPDQARACWRAAVKNIEKDPRIAPAAMALAFRLNLEKEVGVLRKYLDQLVGQEDSGIQLLDLDEAIEVFKQQQKSLEKANNLYKEAAIPIHFLLEQTNYPLAAVYYQLARENEEKSAPATTPPVFFRHGGKDTDFEQEVQAFYLDLTALLTAAHIEILPIVEQHFGPINIAHTLPMALMEQIEGLSHAQQSRLEFADQVQKLVSNNKIKVAQAPAKMVIEPGNPQEPIFVVRHNIANNPEQNNTDIKYQAILKALKTHSLISDEEYATALDMMGVDNAAHIVPIGAEIFFDENTLFPLGQAGLVDVISRHFIISVTPEYFKSLTEESTADSKQKLARDWIDKLRERVTNGIENGTYKVLPDLKEKEDNALDLDRSYTSRTFTDLVRKNYTSHDCVWVDDRYFNNYKTVNNAAVVSTLEVLELLYKKGKISEPTYYAKRNQLRAANYRYIPLTEAELTYHLKKAPIKDGALQETDDLKLIRKYHNACLIHADLFQLPPLPPQSPNQNGEIPFMLVSHGAISEALVKLWQAYADDELAIRASWLVDHLYTGILGYGHLLARKNPNQDYATLGAMEIVSLLSRGQTLRSMDIKDSNGDTKYRLFCDWVEENFARYRLYNKELTRLAAENIKNSLENFYKTVAQGALVTEKEKLKESWIKVQTRAAVHCLPNSIINALTVDEAFVKEYGIQSTNLVNVGDLSFTSEEFFKAVREALGNGSAPSHTYQSRTDDAILRRKPSEKGELVISVARVGEKGEINLRDSIFSLLSDDEDIVREALESNKIEWFDNTKQPTCKFIDTIQKIKDPVKRAIEASKLRARSLENRYTNLDRALNNGEQITVQNISALSMSGLGNHYRLHNSSNQYANTAQELIEEVGIERALARLVCLPLNLPETVISHLLNLPKESRGKIIQEATKNFTSPVSRLHLLDIVIKCLSNEEGKEQADSIIKSLLTVNFDKEYQLFRTLLEYSYREIDLLVLEDEAPLSQKLLASWAHASRLYNTLCPAHERIDGLIDFVKQGIPQHSMGSLFSRNLNEQRDLLYPGMLQPAFLNVHGLLSVLKETKSQILDEETKANFISKAFIKRDEIYLPSLSLLLDPGLCENSSDSFFSGDRKVLAQGILGEELCEILSSERLKSEAKSAIDALIENSLDKNAWVILSQIVGHGNVYPELNPFTAELILKLDLDLIADQAPDIVPMILNFISKYCITTTSTDLIEYTKNAMQNLGKHLEGASINEDSKEPIREQLLEAAYILSFIEETAEAKAQAFSKLTLNLVRNSVELSKWMGTRFSTLVWQLPAGQLKGVWELILELRARY